MSNNDSRPIRQTQGVSNETIISHHISSSKQQKQQHVPNNNHSSSITTSKYLNGNMYNVNVFQSSFPIPEPTKPGLSEHLNYHRYGNHYRNNNHNSRNQYYNHNGASSSSSNIYNNNNNLLTTTGLVYRSADSTQRALHELTQKRIKAMERRRAAILLILMASIAWSVHYMTSIDHELIMMNTDPSSYSSSSSSSSSGIWNSIFGFSNERNGKQEFGEDNSTTPNSKQQQKGEEDGEQQLLALSDALPPVEEEILEEGKEFLEPLRYFADVDSPQRVSDSNYFFHVPRSGGQTMKDVAGKCLGRTLASEVGVRDGHSEDVSLQVWEYMGAKYVNVDTTSIDGLYRAAKLGLAESQFAEMISSSYFQDVGMLFDLYHKGRAFILFRHPIERAVSMYYYRIKGENANLDPSITIEDYAQGNGIENNWITRFLTNKMEGELTKEHLEQAKEILARKFLIGFLDDGKETIERLMKYFRWTFDEDETRRMEQEDCIQQLLTDGTNHNSEAYEYPKKGSQAFALISWQTQFDIKLYDYARELFEIQTKEWGSKERKKEMKKKKKGNQ